MSIEDDEEEVNRQGGGGGGEGGKVGRRELGKRVLLLHRRIRKGAERESGEGESKSGRKRRRRKGSVSPQIERECPSNVVRSARREAPLPPSPSPPPVGIAAEGGRGGGI